MVKSAALASTPSSSTEAYYFDQRIADAAVEYFPRYLRFVEGEWAGRPFVLSKWQAHHTGQMFGWRRRADGLRRYRRVRGWVPRKNGKTEWFAGIGHLLTIGEAEPTAQVFSHAADRAQASIIFEKASRMASLSNELSALYEVTRNALVCTRLMSSFRPLSGDPAGKHGLSPHGLIGDEAHEWRDGRLHTFLVQGMGARRQPLDAIISTAGEIKTYAHELYLQTLQILADPAIDPETYCFNYAADPDDDWTDPEVWKKANPNLGVSLKLEYLADECRRAMMSPRLENDFKRYHLNIWVEQATRWFPMRMWPANTERPDDPEFWRELPELCAGEDCFGGLDLASTEDIAALVWRFKRPGGRTVLIPRLFLPEATIARRSSPRTPYDHWVRIGALIPTPGNVTDYDFIEAAVLKDAQEFRVRGLAIDRFNATQVAVNLANEGVEVQLFGQGFVSMSAPSKELERLFLSGELEHGNHPVMKWMFGNATYRKDPAGNIKPDKERASEKIDGVVAAIEAIGIANAAEPQSESIYETRGFRFVG